MHTTEALVKAQRAFFQTGRTLPYEWRMQALNRLEQSILQMEDEINEALAADLHKSSFESYMTEVGMTLSEIRYIKKHLKTWMKTKQVPTPLAQFPGRSFEIMEPYGVTLIMAPWNYPFMLCMEPLAGAIAAGNCAVLKPSAYAKNTGSVMAKLIRQTFPTRYIAVVEGGRAENTELLEQRFDYIFFTGSVRVGRLVMEKAARHLTPVSLELGGKSPCIVDRRADLSLAAKRIVFGKYLNSGQTCVAPDYLLVQESVKEPLLRHLVYWIRKMYKEAPLENRDYPKMINEKHFRRVLGLIDQKRVLIGGGYNEETLQIEPTIMTDVTWDDAIMKEEIFGPVLPVLTYGGEEELLQLLQSREKPLALYLFSRDRRLQKKILSEISFGGGCINDTIIHLATPYMGFGGVGQSGMGSYHGQKSFETFSHRKSIIRKADWLDLPIRYQPYSKTKERLLKLFMR